MMPPERTCRSGQVAKVGDFLFEHLRQERIRVFQLHTDAADGDSIIKQVSSRSQI